jgi:hypothetical protein
VNEEEEDFNVLRHGGGEVCLVLGCPRIRGMCGFGELGPCLDSGITALLERHPRCLVLCLYVWLSVRVCTAGYLLYWMCTQHAPSAALEAKVPNENSGPNLPNPRLSLI